MATTPETHPITEPIDVLIKRDHAEIEALFEKYKVAGTVDEKSHIVREIIKALSIHSYCEESVFYPYIRDHVVGGNDTYNACIAEHQTLKEDLAKLGNMRAEDLGFDAAVCHVLNLTLKHVRDHEEAEVLPKLMPLLTLQKAQELGKSFLNARPWAPTHAHPKAALWSAPLVAVADKISDMFSSSSTSSSTAADKEKGEQGIPIEVSKAGGGVMNIPVQKSESGAVVQEQTSGARVL